MNKILIIIGIIILFICIDILYILFKKHEEEKDKRIQVLEKRIFDTEKLIKLEIKGVLNNIDIRDQKILKYIEESNNRFKKLERKNKNE